MSLYAQHGYGKGNKIKYAAQAGTIDGVIFSARHEKPSNVKQCIAELKEIREDFTAMLDPEFFVSYLQDPRDGCLPDHWSSYYSAGRTRRDFRGPKALLKHAKNTLVAQMNLGVDRLVSPSIFFRSFDENACEVAMQLAFASVEAHAQIEDAPPILISFQIEESALNYAEPMERFLDEMTAAELPGFYLTFGRPDSIRWPRCREEVLARMMYIVHVLKLNDREVYCGYSDWGGLLFRAVGADAFATGWHLSSKTFRISSFCGSKTGGRQVLYYSSVPLLNQIRLTDVMAVRRRQISHLVRSRTPADRRIADWSLQLAQLQHWVSSSLQGDVESNLDSLDTRLSTAAAAFQQIRDAGVIFDQADVDGHVKDWQKAIRQFRVLAELDDQG